MLRIRLFRAGKKNQPFFKVVVTDKRNPPRGGRAVEILGFYNPLTKEKNIKKERAEYWLSVGAQPSDAMHNLLVSEGILKDKKIPVHKKPKAKEKKEAAPLEAKTAEEKKPKEEKPAAKKSIPLKEEKDSKKEKPKEKKEEPEKTEEKQAVKKEKKPEEKTDDVPLKEEKKEENK